MKLFHLFSYYRGRRAPLSNGARGTISLSAILLVILLLAAGCNSERQSADRGEEATNIILFIGDGMGVAHVTAAMTVAGGDLHMTSMPYAGLVTTDAYENYVTDSAAGATAIASGIKTRNGMLGMSPDTIPVISLFNIAKEAGLATGIVSTCRVTHATPAAFFANNESRRNGEEIAADMLNGAADLFFGGGLDHFTQRADGRDIVKELEEMGYTIARSADEIDILEKLPVGGLFYEGHMPKASEGRSVSLKEMTGKALDLLSENKNGFILMVEGSMIDWGGHDNDTDYIVSETLDMDEAVGVALDFAERNPGTLVLVASDHETGGMVLTGGSRSGQRVVARYATTGHSATMVPLFSAGTAAGNFTGVMDNTDLFHRMISALGLDN